jgi:hypothetical protein
VRIPGKKRPGIMVAIVIFIIAIICTGFIMIVMDQVFQADTSFVNTGPFSVGYYASPTLLFFQDGWIWMSLVVLGGLSIWLYLRAQESAVEQPQ